MKNIMVYCGFILVAGLLLLVRPIRCQTNIDDSEKINNYRTNLCKKNGGGEEALRYFLNYEKLEEECMEQQNTYFTQMKSELDEAKKTGSLYEVCTKLCKSDEYSELYKCLSDISEKAKPCWDPEQQNTYINDGQNAMKDLFEFLCYKDGDQIAVFVAEDGFDCLEHKAEEINKRCQNCSTFHKQLTCWNFELKKCSNPPKIIDAFFKFQKKHKDIKPDSSNSFAASIYIILFSSVILVLLSLY